jgi:hypothetical protein
MTTRILVCGSREWPGTWEDIAAHFPDEEEECHLVVIHGACSRLVRKVSFGRTFENVEVSVDMIADFAARNLGHDVEPYPVDHAIDGPWPAAGPRRNARMLGDGAPDRGLAFGPLYKPARSVLVRGIPFPTTGTGDMVRRMLRAGLSVRWVPAPNAHAQDLTAMPSPPGAT